MEFVLGAVFVGILVFVADYVIIPLSNWLEKRAIFNYHPRFGLQRYKKRQARGLLREGLKLLRSGLVDDADLRFGAALKVNPQLVESLSRRRQRRLQSELEENSGGLNATHLLLLLRAVED